MIDRAKIQQFWDSRANTYGQVRFESVANLEQDDSNVRLKIAEETERVSDWIGDLAGRRVLDLGAGVGQWAFRLAARGAHVTAVERSQPLVDIGRAEVAARGSANVEFVCAPAESYRPDHRFDLVFVSGLFVYLDDEQADELMDNLPYMVHPAARVLVRDGSGVGRRHEIDDRWSEHLEANYSAVYRTPGEYESLFAARGFSLVRSENMFPEGHPLNKYPETRLRLFVFDCSKVHT